jgi:hypothetical protein
MNTPNLPQGKPKRNKNTRSAAVSRFTTEELAELAAFDAALDDEDIVLTPEERALSKKLDAEAESFGVQPKRKPRGKRDTGLPQPSEAEKKALRQARNRAYQAAHREEINARQRTYAMAHREEIKAYYEANIEKIRARAREYSRTHRAELNAKARARRAEKKRLREQERKDDS